MALKGKDNAEKIWNYFKGKGMNDFAIAGIMGNIQQESGCNPKNLQNTGNKKLGIKFTKGITKRVIFTLT